MVTMRPLTAVLAIALVTMPVPAVAEPETWRLEGWSKTDFTRSRIEWRDILSGGPPKDGIPSIDAPMFKAAADDTELADVEPVITLEIDRDARAYPLRILIWHEIVNDVVGGTPVAVTYCPLCNSSIVFDRRLPPRVLEFGTTGKLRNSDLVMYDRQTESWWQQFTGEAIVGALTGAELKLIPSRLESFREFRDRNPNGKLLIPSNPEARGYGRNPYEGYDTSSRPFLYRGELPTAIEPMARVVVARLDRRTPLIVSLEFLRQQRTITIDTVTLRWRAGQASAVDAREIAKGRDVGTVEAIATTADGRDQPIPYDVTFAFVAHAFHPQIAIINGPAHLRP